MVTTPEDLEGITWEDPMWRPPQGFDRHWRHPRVDDDEWPGTPHADSGVVEAGAFLYFDAAERGGPTRSVAQPVEQDPVVAALQGRDDLRVIEMQEERRVRYKAAQRRWREQRGIEHPSRKDRPGNSRESAAEYARRYRARKRGEDPGLTRRQEAKLGAVARFLDRRR